MIAIFIRVGDKMITIVIRVGEGRGKMITIVII